MKKKKRRSAAAVSLVVLVVVVAVCLGYGFERLIRRPAAPPTVDVKTPEVRLTLITVYRKCGHTEDKSETTETDIREISLKYKGWRMESNQNDDILLTRDVLELCPVCEREEFMGIFQEKVAVFHGRPYKRGPVKEVLSLEIKDLPEQETQDLAEGIVLNDNREKLRLLEGLSSLKDG